MSLRQFLLLNLTAVLEDLAANVVDISLMDFFSYDQFYVFYHKFVRLDLFVRGWWTESSH